MRTLALAAALAALALPAAAQEARIRTGEHATFSRLVVYLPEAAEYAVEPGEGTFAIDFGRDFRIDTSAVFDFIPRTRVAGVTAGTGRFALELACDCVVTVERVNERIVFLDVNDPGTVPEPTPEPALAAAAPAAPRHTPSIRLPALAPEGAATLLPGGLTVAETRPPRAHGPAPTAAPAATPALPETAATTLDIAEQIARATAQGLLDPRSDLPPPTRPERRPAAAETAPKPASTSAHVEVVDAGTRSHVTIRSSLDEALGRNVAGALGEIGMAGPCLDDATFEVTSFAAEGLTGLARLRAQAVGEFDRANPVGVADLARAYLGLTFGAEARLTLQSFRAQIAEADILLAMADIVDDGRAQTPGRLATQYACPGAGALWAALSAPRIPDDAELDTNALVLAFSALPAPMRTHLGPTLAERLVTYGAVDTASVIRSAILRAPGEPSVETELLDATIALGKGRAAEADATLAQVVEETSGRNLAAVERLIERRLAAGEPVEDEVLAAADALIYEHRGTPQAYRLAELRIEGLARSGQARRALAVLDETGRRLPEATVSRLRGISYSEAARLLDDPEFLLVAVNAGRALGHTPEEMAARRAIARRLGQMELFTLADGLGVEEGRLADSGPHGAAPEMPPQLRGPLPEGGAPLERTAALLDHSAELRARLATVLAEAPAR